MSIRSFVGLAGLAALTALACGTDRGTNPANTGDTDPHSVAGVNDDGHTAGDTNSPSRGDNHDTTTTNAGDPANDSGEDNANPGEDSNDPTSHEDDGTTTDGGDDDSTDTGTHPTPPPFVDTCEPEDLEPLGTKPTLSPLAHLSLMQQGLFVKEGSLMTVSYNEGYNLNFEITEAEAWALLPCNLSPLPIRIIESDTEPRYYLSLYMAVLDSSQATTISTTRIDLFTYGRTGDGDLSLHFVSSYMGIPAEIRNNAFAFDMLEEIFAFFARDSRTGEPAYPHYFADELTVSHDTFKLVYGDSTLEAVPCAPLTDNERFTLDFVNVNSQIYRSPIDKNVNYFNQSFIKANVQTRDPQCIRHENLTGIHPMLRDLHSIQFYGSQDKKITWYYEMCTGDDCGNPLQ